MKLLTGNVTPRLNVICDKTGNTLTEMEDILGRWKEYCGEMYGKEENEEIIGQQNTTTKEQEPNDR